MEGRSGRGRKLEPLYSWERRTELIRLVPAGEVGHAQKHKGVGKKRRMSSDLSGCGSSVDDGLMGARARTDCKKNPLHGFSPQSTGRNAFCIVT